MTGVAVAPSDSSLVVVGEVAVGGVGGVGVVVLGLVHESTNVGVEAKGEFDLECDGWVTIFFLSWF
jgi:hypothetical protein